MTATYQKLNLNLMYPENWKLTDDSGSNLPCSISLESPTGDALWSLHLYEAQEDQDVILKDTLIPLQETYPDFELAPVTPNLNFGAEVQLGASTGVEAYFYCLDFLIRLRLQVVQAKDYQLLFWFQAEDREFEKFDPVFRAMAISVLQ